jgi:hypothetical protein
LHRINEAGRKYQEYTERVIETEFFSVWLDSYNVPLEGFGHQFIMPAALDPEDDLWLAIKQVYSPTIS